MRTGRVLGVDLGLRRTGLAVSDELQLAVRPLQNLIPRSRAEDIAALLTLIDELDVQDVVIGHPVLPRSGEEGPMAKRARGFAETLQGALTQAGRPATRVHLVDERGTSREAAQRLVQSGVRKGRRKAALDGEAARILVETFIATGGFAKGEP